MNKFKNAFDGKMYVLSRDLDVCLPLLLLLRDRRLITDEQLEALKVMKLNFEKVYELLVILSRLDDSKFDVFCSVLNDVNQSAIIKIIRPDSEPRAAESQEIADKYSFCVPEKQLHLTSGSKRDAFKAELAEILEADYGLPDELYVHKMLQLSECEDITQHRETYRCQVHSRVTRLLDYVVQNQRNRNEDLLNTVKNNSFLDSLVKTRQKHVVNFIIQDGKIDHSRFGDMFPVNEQQRMRLHPRPSITDNSSMNARHPSLQAILTAKGVISVGQQDYIMADVPRRTSNERLLLIMKRRSLAHVKAFIDCLIETGQKDVVEGLNERGVFVRIHTTILPGPPTVTNEDKRDRESWFSKIVNWILSRFKKSDQYPPVRDAVSYLQNKGCALKYVEANQSIAWYILCQTPDALESLRNMYVSNELALVVHDIFNSLCGGCGTKLPLRVEWRADNNEFSRNVSFETHCHLFGTSLLETADEKVRNEGIMDTKDVI